MIEWAQGALDLFKDFHKANTALIDGFAPFPSNHLSLVRKDGALDFYHGVLRAVDSDGRKVLDDVDYQDYLKYIGEEVRSWSYMKFPYLRSLGKEKGWYRVGPAGPAQHLRLHPDAPGPERVRDLQGLHRRQAQQHDPALRTGPGSSSSSTRPR